MGNASGKEDGDPLGRSVGESGFRDVNAPPGRVGSSDSMANSPPGSPPRSRSPLSFAPQVPVSPLQRVNGPPLNQMWQTESNEANDLPSERGIPTLITWSYGGSDVAVKGSWDNWKSRKILQRAGKDNSILLVLPSGIYHYKFEVDGELRYIPDLPSVPDDAGGVCNILDVHDYVPDNLDGIAEFEAPPSPDSSYTQAFPGDDDFAKEPLAVPPQLHMTVLGRENSEEEASSSSSSSLKPEHAVLNHLYIEKGWASQSVVALGLTHRYQSKYVTVVLYKPIST